MSRESPELLRKMEGHIGGCQVTFYAIDHDTDWQGAMQRLEPDILTHDVLIPEYFTQELDAVGMDTPFIGLFEATFYEASHISPMAQTLEEIAAAHGKEMVVMDPADALIFNLYYGGVPAALLINSCIAFLNAGYTLDHMRATPDLSLETRTLSRRTLIRQAAIGAASFIGGAYGVASISGGPGLFQETPNMRDLRRVILAQGVLQYCFDPANKGKSIAMIYPPEHVKEIMHYLQNQNARLGRLALYDKLPGIVRSIRTYLYDSLKQHWRLVSETPIHG